MAHHDHAHHHHGPEGPVNVNTAFIAGIGLNLLFVITEVIVGLMHHSMSLLTDAGHNLGDVASLVLSLLAFRLATRKSNQTFTYGYKKATVLASLFNAVFLLITVGILGFESVRRLVRPAAVQGNVIAWVAAAGIVINVATALLFFSNRKRDLNIKSAYLHMMSDALVSFGVVCGGILIAFTGWYWVDPLVGILIMVIILVSTWSLLADSFRLSVDAVPSGIDMHEIRDIIGRQPDVTDVHHVHIWALSTTENALTAHVSLNDSLDFGEKMKRVSRIKHELMHHNIQHSTIEVEAAVSGCMEKDC